MVRYRFFDWDQLPDALLAALADGIDGDGSASAATRLETTYGARPDDAFVQTTWPTLLSAWLENDVGARTNVVEALRATELGDLTIDASTTDGQLAYIRSCPDAPSLRRVVLAELLTFGEEPYLAPIRSGVSHAIDDLEPSPLDGPFEALDKWVLDTLSKIFRGPVRRGTDGDIEIPRGSSSTYVRVNRDYSVIHVFSHLVQGMTPDPEIYEAVNAINTQVPLAKAVVVDEGRSVVLNAELLADSVTPFELLATLDVVSEAADHFDTLLAERFGGSTRLPDEPPDEIDLDALS